MTNTIKYSLTALIIIIVLFFVNQRLQSKHRIETENIYLGNIDKISKIHISEKDNVIELIKTDSTWSILQAESLVVKENQLDRIFKESGFEWRDAGCSMCLGMNPDILSPGERCASTSNRNFEGRQGPGGLTHLVSPQMAAAAAIQGTFVDIRDWSFR